MMPRTFLANQYGHMGGAQTGSLIGMALGIVAVALAPATFGTSFALAAGIGSLVGGLAGGFYDTMTAPDQVQEQQSLADLKIQTSSFGKVLVQLWGQQRISGNIFWATDKVEHQHRESTSAGKGGGPEQVTITKTYTISMAIGLTDTRMTGPILGGIFRAWRDTTLVMDRGQSAGGAIQTWTVQDGGFDYQVGDILFADSGNRDATFQVLVVQAGGELVTLELLTPGSGYTVWVEGHPIALRPRTGHGDHGTLAVLAVSGNVLPANWIFYPGTADQLPDPTMEGILGVGNVPGYRYTSYVVMADEDLGRSGRTFNYTFEMAQRDGGASLLEVVTALTTAAGLSGHVDLLELPIGTVHLALVSIEALRAPLEHLMQMYRFYVVESGTTLIFRQRGSGPVVATIPEGDTDAGEHHHGERGIETRRQQELALPTQLSLTYVDPLANYQQNVQRAQRFLPATTIENARTISTSLALEAARAKQTAQELLQDAWLQREPLQTVLPRKYAYLEPGDRVTLTARGLQYALVLTETAYGQPGLLEVTAQTDTAWIVNAPGAAPALAVFPHPVLRRVGATTPILLNVPALTSSDLAPRYHVAYQGVDVPWPGGALYRSVDGGTTYTQVDSGTLEGLTGTVATAAAADWHVLDEQTVITVVMEQGPLMSISDLALYNGGNLSILGNEVLAFGIATLIDVNTYELTRLLRGRRGTEWAVETHGADETFVVLDVSVHALIMTLADRFVARPFKAVTAGQFIADALVVDFTPTAANLNDWTVAQPLAEQAGGDWQLSWWMRSRFAGEWVDGGGVGFDVDFVGFRVDIFLDGTYTTVQRSTLTDGGTPLDPEARKTWYYSSFDQTTDFGAPQSTLYYRIFEVTNNGLSHPENLVTA